MARTFPPAGPAEPPEDRSWAEPPVTGLRWFNLGTVPASVTPPRTWRRAAWFAVGTATVVAVALGFATFALVDTPPDATTAGALPVQLSPQRLLITDLPGDTATTTGTGPATAAPPGPESVGDRTERYFALVVGSPAAAHGLTSGPMRAEGPEGIAARYASVRRVEIRKITVHPTRSSTRSTLVVTRTDGSTSTLVRELTFTTGHDPRILLDVPAP